eukprot:5197196-Alexandrium_andersonii.AAC.1
MAEPPNARRSLVDRIVAQMAFAQDRVRQGSPGLTVLDDQDSQGRITAALRGDAIVHCDLRRRALL